MRYRSGIGKDFPADMPPKPMRARDLRDSLREFHFHVEYLDCWVDVAPAPDMHVFFDGEG